MFSHITGQHAIKERLVRSVREQRIPHAQLLHGPEGVGKLALAVTFAQYISCNHRTQTDACGVCPSCVNHNQLAHPDLHFVFPHYQTRRKTSMVCDDFYRRFRKMYINNPYFSVNDWYEKIGEGAQAGNDLCQ